MRNSDLEIEIAIYLWNQAINNLAPNWKVWISYKLFLNENGIYLFKFYCWQYYGRCLPFAPLPPARTPLQAFPILLSINGLCIYVLRILYLCIFTDSSFI